MDLRLTPCETCQSEGRIIVCDYDARACRYDDRDIGPCPDCDGTGREIIEVQPVEMADLDEFTTYWNGREFVACYREEEADEFNGEAFGFNPDRELAIADLVVNFPREVRP